MEKEKKKVTKKETVKKETAKNKVKKNDIAITTTVVIKAIANTIDETIMITFFLLFLFCFFEGELK